MWIEIDPSKDQGKEAYVKRGIPTHARWLLLKIGRRGRGIPLPSRLRPLLTQEWSGAVSRSRHQVRRSNEHRDLGRDHRRMSEGRRRMRSTIVQPAGRISQPGYNFCASPTYFPQRCAVSDVGATTINEAMRYEFGRRWPISPWPRVCLNGVVAAALWRTLPDLRAGKLPDPPAGPIKNKKGKNRRDIRSSSEVRAPAGAPKSGADVTLRSRTRDRRKTPTNHGIVDAAYHQRLAQFLFRSRSL